MAVTKLEADREELCPGEVVTITATTTPPAGSVFWSVGESENALPLQIVAAFVTDLVLRAFKHCGGFKGTLYDFVKTCREIALIPISGVIGRMRQALIAAAVSLELLEAIPQEQP